MGEARARSLRARIGSSPAPGPIETRRGIEWHALGGERDARLLAPLFARIEAADNPPYRTSADEVREMLSPARTWRGTGAWMTRGIAAGEMVAFGIVGLRRSGVLECLCHGGVDPRFRKLGLGRALIDWQVATARSMLAEIDTTEPAQIVMHVDSGQEDLEDQLVLAGFHWARTYYELRADLRSAPEAPRLGPLVSVVPWTPDLEGPTRRASNRLSELEWGRPPQTEEQWLMGRTGFVPEWSFVALDKTSDRAKVIGFLMASRYDQDWAALGWKEGYVDLLGVLPQHRHAGVAEALIVASMKAQAADGMDRIATGVGSANHSGALALYETLGFQTVGATKLYALNV